MNPGRVLRVAWMDLLSAAAFFLIWMLRDHVAPETLSALLLWPVVFEMMLVFALALAGMGSGIGDARARNAWLALVAGLYLGLAWLGGRASGLPLLWLAALWLLGARVRPPARQSWLGNAHRQWLFGDALPAAVMVWVPAFFAYLLLIALVPGDCRNGADGVRHCTSPAWIFAAVWTPYFIAEAIVRAMRTGRLTPAARE